MSLEKLNEWVQEAILDGWECKPMYDNESTDTAARLTKEGFITQILRRPPGFITGQTKWYLSQHIWGPDGMHIPNSYPYSMETIQAGLTICEKCKKVGPTKRVGFVNRVCEACYPEQKRLIETPGWCD